MTSQVRAKATEPFFSTRGHAGGTGLGLTMVHDIVIRSGAAMNIDSELGRGTTITLLLPASSQPTSPE
jgi:signal transduction histidine kinase